MKTLNTKGQTQMIDLMFAVFIFLLLFATLALAWNNSYTKSLAEQDFFEMQSKCLELSSFLLKDKGTPIDWQNQNLSDVVTFGLASKDRVVETNKLSALQTFSDVNYLRVRELLGVAPYDFYFELTILGNPLPETSFGLSPAADSEVASIRRIVEYNGGEALVVIKLHE